MPAVSWTSLCAPAARGADRPPPRGRSARRPPRRPVRRPLGGQRDDGVDGRVDLGDPFQVQRRAPRGRRSPGPPPRPPSRAPSCSSRSRCCCRRCRRRCSCPHVSSPISVCQRWSTGHFSLPLSDATAGDPGAHGGPRQGSRRSDDHPLHERTSARRRYVPLRRRVHSPGGGRRPDRRRRGDRGGFCRPAVYGAARRPPPRATFSTLPKNSAAVRFDTPTIIR